jgi:hypothetical protein
MPLLEFLIQIKIDFTNTNLLKRRISSTEQEVTSCVDVVNGASATNSGGNSLFPGGRSHLNFRRNFQISDKPPHLHSKRLFLALL